MKILIAVPTFENILPDTFKSIYDLDKGGHTCDFEYVRGYDCATARNCMADMAADYDYILMVDSDVVLPKDALVNMLEDAKDVCLGAYEDKKFPGKTCLCKIFDEMGNPYYHYPGESLYSWSEIQSEGFHKVEIRGGGLGCALIKTSVFQSLEYPWFEFVNYKDRHGKLSEDLFFCRLCRKNGIPIYMDTRVWCEHVFRIKQGAKL